jgi:DNA polymerase-1
MEVVKTPDAFWFMMYALGNPDITALFCDIETTGLDPYTTHMLILSIRGGGVTYVIDFLSLGSEYVKQLKPLLENSAVKVFHNAVFDYKHIYHHGGIEIKNVHCSLVTDQLINAGLFYDYSLAHVAERRLGIAMKKEIRNSFINRDLSAPFTDEEIQYAGNDVDVLEEIYNQQLKDIKEKGLERVYELECKLTPIVSMMEYNGVNIDEQRLRDALPIAEELIKRTDVSIQDDLIVAGAVDEIVFSRDGYTAINTGSPKQMLAAFNKVGINVKSLNNKELSDWDSLWSKKHGAIQQDTYAALFDDDDDIHIGFNHPLLKKHAVRTAVAKLKGTYIEGLAARINPNTRRIHPGFKQCGAVATGRMSSVSPNFQNLTNTIKLRNLGLADSCDVRSMFIPTPGYDFVICDYSGIELVILALLSGDERLKYELLQGDIHAFVANNLEGDKIKYALGELITPKNKKQGNHRSIRDDFKKVSYGIVYGSTGYNLYRTLYFSLASAGLVINQKDADRWVEDWKAKLFPDTGRLLANNAEYAVTRGYTESVLGRKRFWPIEVRYDKWRSLAAQREGMNQPIQSTSADITKLALVLLNERINHDYARILAAVHDEILTESKHEYTEECMAVVQGAMVDAGYILFPNAEPGIIQAEPKNSSRYDK